MPDFTKSNARLEEISSYLDAIKKPKDREMAIRATLIALEMGKEVQEKTIVVLIHGIRTFAEWQDKVKNEFSQDLNITVIAIGYDYFDLLRFWCPWYFRNAPIRRVEQQLRNITSENSHAKLVVVAHSFGTYIISKILKSSPDIRIERLLLCGSIIKTDWRWDLVPQRPKLILNDVGDRDIFPVLAKATSWGYGASGTFGFKAQEVNDRFHHCKHSDFFELDHIKNYWVPFLKEAHIAQSDYSASRIQPSKIIKIVNVVPLKSLLAGLVVLGMMAY
jgi:pimeloyl-ACP methyl ester carboxylesterase